jgi:PAS domain S-box-containing protein
MPETRTKKLTIPDLNTFSIESEYRYKQLLECLPAAIYTCDIHGYVNLYNKAAVKLWGREPEVGKDLWCGSWHIYDIYGNPVALDTCPMALALKEKRAIKGHEIVIERPDGVRRNVLPHPEPLFDRSGNMIGAVNMLVDITDYKLVEEALRESELRFRTLAEQAPVMIWMADESNQVNFLNAKWCEFTGLPVEDGYGTGWTELIHPEDRQKAEMEWKLATQNRQHYFSKFRYKNSKAEYRIINAECSPWISNGEFMGYIGMLTDVTLEENAKTLLENLVEDRTKELKRTNAELARSNMELEQFAYVASHDLQEPLRKIQAFSELVQKDNKEIMTSQSHIFLQKIINSANRLSVLIDDLLNFSRLSRQNDFVAETDLNEVLSKIKTDLEIQVLMKNAEIKSDVLPVIEAVPLQVNQLFHNLISNALKFTSPQHPPEIYISCRHLTPEQVQEFPELNKNYSYYEFVFCDNGIGFEPEYADKIFMIFQRLHEQYVYNGSGIGLALCKKIVLNHRGKIYAESEPGKGAKFTIILPEKLTRKK